MPRNGSGVYSKPAGTTAVADTLIESAKYNQTIDDLVADANEARPITAGGTGATSKSGATTALEAVSYGASQTLTAAQQTQARSNVSAPLKGHIYGLTLSNNVTDPTNDIDIAAGEAASTEANPVLMVLSSAITKRLDAAWAVGSGNGGLDTGAIANGTYHVWLIRRSDTGVVDALFSASATSPTMPTNYDQKAYLWPIIRSGGTILGFKQVGNAFTLDVGVTERSSTAAFAEALFTLTAVPTGVAVSPMLMYRHVQGTVGNVTAFVASASKTLDAADQVAYTAAAGEGHTARVDNTFTNTSAQVKLAVTISSGTLAAGMLVTRGWVYPR